MGVLLNKSAMFLGLYSVSDRWINGGGKRGNGSTLTGRKLGPSATLTTTNTIRIGLGLNAGPRIRQLIACTKTQPIFFLTQVIPEKSKCKVNTCPEYFDRKTKAYSRLTHLLHRMSTLRTVLY